MRRNLIRKLRAGEPLFPDILGYEETVVPQIQNAILSKHDMLFLGLRGQAKTRMLRQLVHLLDDAMPIVAGSEVNDHPFAPSEPSTPATWSPSTGDETPIDWVGRDAALPREARHARRDHRRPDRRDRHDQARRGPLPLERADDALRPDPAHATAGSSASTSCPTSRPRSRSACSTCSKSATSRSAAIPVRLDLDLCMVFSANPEDYTNRGRIVTPLKDRIGSVVRTHYPLTRELGIAISDENAWLDRDGGPRRRCRSSSRRSRGDRRGWPGAARRQPAVGRLGPDVDREPRERRLATPSAAACSTARTWIVPRISDLVALAPSTRGKLELTMTEDDGQEDSSS